MAAIELILAILAAYYLSIVITQTNGPWDSLYKFRNLKAVDNFGLFECLICLSFWIALIISIVLFDNWLLYTLGISGAVVALNNLLENI